jgi:hypothetical protein
LDAAAAAARADQRPLDLLTVLVDQLVVAEAVAGAGGTTRYRMLEPVRQFGLALLVEQDALAAHAACVLDLTEQAAAGLRRPEQLDWLRRLDDAEPDLPRGRRDAGGGRRPGEQADRVPAADQRVHGGAARQADLFQDRRPGTGRRHRARAAAQRRR